MTKRILLMLSVLMILSAVPAFAGPVPSKATDSREADLTVIRDVVANEEVAVALAAQGLTAEEVQSRLASLSNEEVHSLAQNLDQIQAAGLTREQWIWIGVGALAALILVTVV